MIPVNFLVFELAEGNIREFIDFDKEISTAFVLKTLHDTFVGVSQLHSKDIVHQDIKPSNVLMFEATQSKLGDLGRAGMFGYEPPHENCDVPGDHGYAPIEQLYGHIHPDWHIRRKGGDLFSLGSLIYFYFNSISLTCEIYNSLPEKLRFDYYRGNYDKVVPSIENVLTDIYIEFTENIPGDLGVSLVRMIQELCNPNVEERGHPLNKVGNQNQFSLERYITKLDYLFKKTSRDAWGKYEYK